jgi:hypothetical protein
MDASRTHEVTQGQSIWSWVLIGVAALAIAGALVFTLDVTGGDDTVRRPATADVQGQVEAPAADYPLHGRGQMTIREDATDGYAPATAIREGGVYAGTAPIGTPDSFTDVRESGAYYSGAGTATPQDGRCPVKAGC